MPLKQPGFGWVSLMSHGPNVQIRLGLHQALRTLTLAVPRRGPIWCWGDIGPCIYVIHREQDM